MNLIHKSIRRPETIAGIFILAILIGAAILASTISPGDPLRIAGRALLSPFQDATLPLGTDRLGRDVLAGVLHGARTSLLVAVAAAFSAIALGMCIGLIAGFCGGLIDEMLMRVVDAFQIVPGFLLALAFVSVMGASLPTVILAITLGAWPDPARLTRGQVLSIRERDYVASARVIGMHPAEIAFRQILPQAVAPVLALSATIVASAILTESALSFLGLGDPNSVTWGSMIAEGRNVLRSSPWLSIIPGMALVATVIGVHLLGEGLAGSRSATIGLQREDGGTP